MATLDGLGAPGVTTLVAASRRQRPTPASAVVAGYHPLPGRGARQRWRRRRGAALPARSNGRREMGTARRRNAVRMQLATLGQCQRAAAAGLCCSNAARARLSGPEKNRKAQIDGSPEQAGGSPEQADDSPEQADGSPEQADGPLGRWAAAWAAARPTAAVGVFDRAALPSQRARSGLAAGRGDASTHSLGRRRRSGRARTASTPACQACWRTARRAERGLGGR